MASEDSGVNAVLFSDERLKSDLAERLRRHYRGNALDKLYDDDTLFEYQAKVIRKLADAGPCVLIGRCADFVLRDRTDVVRIFVHADHDFCMEQAGKVNSLSDEELEKKLTRVDESRARFYRHHTGCDWYDARNYDLSLNSGVLGFDGVLEEILQYLQVRSQFSVEQ